MSDVFADVNDYLCELARCGGPVRPRSPGVPELFGPDESTLPTEAWVCVGRRGCGTLSAHDVWPCPICGGRVWAAAGPLFGSSLGPLYGEPAPPHRGASSARRPRGRRRPKLAQCRPLFGSIYEFDVWRDDVRDPATAAAEAEIVVSGPRRLLASVQFAPLPDGRTAWRASCQASHAGASSCWTAAETRSEAVRQATDMAARFFGGRSGSLRPNELRPGAKLLGEIERRLAELSSP